MTRACRALLLSMAALVVLVSQLASAFHFVLVAHYACAEHGSIHHGQAPTASAPQSHAKRAGLTGRANVEHDGHDDCAFPARSQNLTATLASSVTSIAPPTSTEVARLSIRTDVEPAVAIYALAPKQSPPGLV